MSKDQRDHNNNSTNEVTEDKFDKLMMSPAVFNRAGFSPIAAAFTISKREISDEIKKIALNEGLDVTGANIQYDYKNNTLLAFVFIPGTSHHLVDDMANNENSAIRSPIYNFSKELKIFMDKFAPEKNRKVIPANRPDLKCVYVDIFKVIDYLFDANNAAFSKKYNQQAKKCKLFVTPEVRGKEFVGITIEKKSFVADKSELLPRKSHTF